MDWGRAIEKNREALGRVLAALVAMAGLSLSGPGDVHAGAPASGAGPRPALPRHLHRAVLRLLRPAEAAARRLIIIAARGMAATSPRARRNDPASFPRIPRARPALPKGEATTGGPKNPPALPLFDALPRRRGRRRPAASGVPRISLPGFSAPAPIVARRPLTPHDAIDAARLCLRLRAVAAVLDDLPAHARRFARWRARREGPAGKGDAPRRVWPLRPGRPHGWRRTGPGGDAIDDVHAVLAAVHDLALWAMERRDTS